MITSPHDKMIRSENERTKSKKRPTKREYYFPHYGRSVKATSLDEAIKIISKIKK